MQADPEQTNLKEIREWVNKFACPACLGVLSVEKTAVLCRGCGRVYPILEGIPVLIAERAD